MRAIRAAVEVPILGISKRVQSDGKALITPTFEDARELVEAGAAMIALDVTCRGQRYGALDRVRRISRELKVPVMADIATLAEALAAADAGADFVLTTMRGYTDDTAGIHAFDLPFVEELARRSPVPVIAEAKSKHQERRSAAPRSKLRRLCWGGRERDHTPRYDRPAVCGRGRFGHTRRSMPRILNIDIEQARAASRVNVQIAEAIRAMIHDGERGRTPFCLPPKCCARSSRSPA